MSDVPGDGDAASTSGDSDGAPTPGDDGDGASTPADGDIPRIELNRRRLLGLAGVGVTGAAWDVFRTAGDADVTAPEDRPAATGAEIDAYVRGCTGFGLDLLAEVSDGGPEEDAPPNAMLSPLGLSTVLAMVWAGARGETERRMAETLRFPHGQETLHPAVGALGYELDGRDGSVQHREVPRVWKVNRFSLGLVNAFWGQADYPFAADFRTTLTENYGTDLREVDFAADPSAARSRINDWGRQASGGRVEELLPPGTVTSRTRFALANAVALRADWQQPFDPDETARDSFSRPDGSSVVVPLMHQEGEFPLLWRHPDDSEVGVGYRVAELPYVGGDLGMVLVVPERDAALAALEREIDAAWLHDRFADLDEQPSGTVEVTMPKFTFGNEFRLVDPLQRLGMTTAFDPQEAEFGGMTDPPEAADGLHLSHVLQDTHVTVDEEGTVAVAVSVGLGEQVSGNPSITLDRPFLFCIRDRPTDAVLFLGRVTDPSRG